MNIDLVGDHTVYNGKTYRDLCTAARAIRDSGEPDSAFTCRRAEVICLTGTYIHAVAERAFREEPRLHYTDYRSFSRDITSETAA